jgi:hypothetical protein
MKIDERFAEMTREITANRGLILPWRNGALSVAKTRLGSALPDRASATTFRAGPMMATDRRGL